MSNIEKHKKIFNKFFKEDLYGRFDNDNNIILSRGNWEDSHVSFPKVFKFCIDYTLKNHWTGYSDSLGHKNTLQALHLLVNAGGDFGYKKDNLALTIGNILTIGFVIRLLKDQLGKVSVLALKPYYPPIIKSINFYFDSFYFVSSLEDEDIILNEIKNLVEDQKIKILFLQNSIGIESRIFSTSFWEKVMGILKEKKDIYLVIDEGLWFERLNYPLSIANDRVIRIVSLSKKYSLAGCKLGFMIAGANFITKFYDYASTNYGGPLSAFFLLAEFIYQFEYIHYSKINRKMGLEILGQEYEISMEKLESLYDDFEKTLDRNYRKFKRNQKIFRDWAKKNQHLIDKIFDFGGINIFVKFKNLQRAYDLFLQLIQDKVSIMPSSCLGDENDSLIRITLLEQKKSLYNGLKRIKENLQKYENHS